MKKDLGLPSVPIPLRLASLSRVGQIKLSPHEIINHFFVDKHTSSNPQIKKWNFEVFWEKK